MIWWMMIGGMMILILGIAAWIEKAEEFCDWCGLPIRTREEGVESVTSVIDMGLTRVRITGIYCSSRCAVIHEHEMRRTSHE